MSSPQSRQAPTGGRPGPAASPKGCWSASACRVWTGVAAVARDKPEVLLLDLGLPDLDGRDVLAMVRSVSDVPVIVATARDDDASVVRLLDAGADDYVIKPFSAAQMDARIRAVLRRL